MSRSVLRLRLVVLFVIVLVAPFARRASAHVVGLSQGVYRVTGATVTVTDTFAGAELASALPGGRDAAARTVVGATVLRADGARCDARLDEVTIATPDASDAVEVRATFVCPAAPRVLGLEAAFVALVGRGHRHLATVVAPGHDEDLVLDADHSAADVDLLAPASPAGGAASARRPAGSFAAMVWTGMQHIWTGYDHLAFLFGLVLIGGRPRVLVGTVSAFTVAHSLTLALAVLHVVTPRASFVEPAIALSIAYVGLENLFVIDPRAHPAIIRRRGQGIAGRWRVTFLFGLLHGFGFASALTALALPRERVVPALFAFNFGVELGQLGVLALVLPGVLLARRSATFRSRGVDGLSAALVLAGVGWFVVRVAP